jgi:hypothetical protein
MQSLEQRLPVAPPKGFLLLESASMICVPRRALALMRFGHPRLRIQQFASGGIWKLFSSQQSARSAKYFHLAHWL